MKDKDATDFYKDHLDLRALALAYFDGLTYHAATFRLPFRGPWLMQTTLARHSIAVTVALCIIPPRWHS